MVNACVIAAALGVVDGGMGGEKGEEEEKCCCEHFVRPSARLGAGEMAEEAFSSDTQCEVM